MSSFILKHGTMLSEKERELEILEIIQRRAEEVHQRDLAKIVGLSLGMTNAIVKRLAQKGWITVRKVNNRNIRYAVTPAGVDQITRRSFSYFKRTIRNVVIYREAIEVFVEEIRRRGFESLLLIGRSDLDFVVEYSCMKNGITYLTDDPAEGESVFFLYSEDYIPDNGTGAEPMSDDASQRVTPDNRGFLQEFLVR